MGGGGGVATLHRSGGCACVRLPVVRADPRSGATVTEMTEMGESARGGGEEGPSYIGARWPGQHDTAIFVGGNGTHGLCSGKGGSEARRGGVSSPSNQMVINGSTGADHARRGC